MNDRKKTLPVYFVQRHGQGPLLVQSPGRVNIIGEHTDYNEGFVLSAAIDLAAYITVSRRDDDSIQLTGLDMNEHFECSAIQLDCRNLSYQYVPFY